MVNHTAINTLDHLLDKALTDWAFEVERGGMTTTEWRRRSDAITEALNQLKGEQHATGK